MFKVGDEVVCLQNYRNQFTKGKTYIIRSVYPEYKPSSLGFELDDLGSTTNGWSSRFFELKSIWEYKQDFDKLVKGE